MEGRRGPLDRLSHFVHAKLLWPMAGSYALASCFPALGLMIRDVSVGEVAFGGSRVRVSLSMLMLASLLLNAGLGVEPGRIRELLRGPRLLAAGSRQTCSSRSPSSSSSRG